MRERLRGSEIDKGARVELREGIWGKLRYKLLQNGNSIEAKAIAMSYRFCCAQHATATTTTTAITNKQKTTNTAKCRQTRQQLKCGKIRKFESMFKENPRGSTTKAELRSVNRKTTTIKAEMQIGNF